MAREITHWPQADPLKALATEHRIAKLHDFDDGTKTGSAWVSWFLTLEVSQHSISSIALRSQGASKTRLLDQAAKR